MSAVMLPGVDPDEFVGVYQRRVGIGDGDCFAACIASALGIAYEALPPISKHDGDPAAIMAAWRTWLHDHEIGLNRWNLSDRGNWRPDGWWIGALGFTTPAGDCWHAELAYHDEFKWDPMPGFGLRPYPKGRIVNGWALVPLDAEEPNQDDSLGRASIPFYSSL